MAEPQRPQPTPARPGGLATAPVSREPAPTAPTTVGPVASEAPPPRRERVELTSGPYLSGYFRQEGCLERASEFPWDELQIEAPAVRSSEFDQATGAIKRAVPEIWAAFETLNVMDSMSEADAIQFWNRGLYDERRASLQAFFGTYSHSELQAVGIALETMLEFLSNPDYPVRIEFGSTAGFSQATGALTVTNLVTSLDVMGITGVNEIERSLATAALPGLGAALAGYIRTRADSAADCILSEL